LEMLEQFARVVTEAHPNWWLLENVPTVPNVTVPGYTVQRLDLNALECGSAQSRLRHFQYGSIYGFVLVPDRKLFVGRSQDICLASEGKRPGRRSFADFCEQQGLPRDFDLPGLVTSAKYAAVGNGVPILMARTIAAAVRDACFRSVDVRLCACGCGRVITGRQRSATPACRKRLERQRKGEFPGSKIAKPVTAWPGHTYPPVESQL
jgi:DNA (cytosine-5)-methyltransferase 1